MEDDKKKKPDDSKNDKVPPKKRGDGEWSLGENWKESVNKDSEITLGNEVGSEVEAEPVSKQPPKKGRMSVLLKVAFFLFSTIFITLLLLQLNTNRKQKISSDSIRIETAQSDGTDIPLPQDLSFPISQQTSSSQQVDNVIASSAKVVEPSSIAQASSAADLQVQPSSPAANSSLQRSSAVVLSSSEKASSSLPKSPIASSEPPRQDFSNVAIRGSIQLLDKDGNMVDTTKSLDKTIFSELTWVAALTTKDNITDTRFAEYVGSQTVLGLLEDDSLKVIDSFVMDGAGYKGDWLQAVDIRGKFATLKPENLKNGNYSLVLSINSTVVTSIKLTIGEVAQAVTPSSTIGGDNINVADINISSSASTAIPLASLQQLHQQPPVEEPVIPALEPSMLQPSPVLDDTSYQPPQQEEVEPQQSASSATQYAAYAERYSGIANLMDNSGVKISRTILLAVDFYADNTIQGEATVSEIGAMTVRGRIYERGLEMVLVSNTDAIQLTGVKRGTTIRGRFTSGTLKESGSFEITQSQ